MPTVQTSHRLRIPFLLAAVCVAVAAPHARCVEKKELEQYEDKALLKWSEKVAKVMRTDRFRLRAELEFAFPGKVVEATTVEEYATWFELLVGKDDQWWRDDAPTPQLGDLFDKVTKQLDVGPVPSLTREEFGKYARRILIPQNPPPVSREPNPDDDADKVFRVLDRNGDGFLDEIELTTDLAENKLFVDTDGDGRIGKAEYREGFRRRAEARAFAQLAKSGEAPRPGELPPAKKKDTLPEWFIRLDADQDGQLSLYECRIGGGSVTLFAEMDLNGDGYLTRDEYLRYAKEKAEAKTEKPALTKPRSRW